MISTQQQSYVYFMMNKNNTVIYTGVSGDLQKRVYEHREKLVDGFTKKYNLSKLVYFEVFDRIDDAIARERQIKAGSRTKKIELIQSTNPDFKDLYDEL
jgi:putative endonuclease